MHNANESDNISNVGNLKDDNNLMYTNSNNDEWYKFNDNESLNDNDNDSNERLTDLREKSLQ